MPSFRFAKGCDHRGRRLVTVLVLAALAVSISGCSCRSETPAEKAAREARELEEEKRRLEEERLKAPLVMSLPMVAPGRRTPPSLVAKPGHWNAVTQPLKANNEDFDGTLTLDVTDKDNQPIAKSRTPFRVSSSRPAVLAKETDKDFETLLYLPEVSGPLGIRATVRDRRSGSLRLPPTRTPLRRLLDHQYHFVVLAKEPARYAFLDALYSVNATLPDSVDKGGYAGDATTVDPAKNYRVVALPVADPSRDVPLPDNPLAWSTVAYLLWDEVDPERLRPAQRDALVDWINWGGQLLVSGPDSLDLLRGSFLEPLLPATSTGAREIGADELRGVQSAWSAALKKGAKPLMGEKPWSGVELRPTRDARAPAGLRGLLYERRVGRGRIVVSGFQLSQRALVAWGAGVDNLYNAALLRRPPRKFARGGFNGDQIVTLWDDKPGIRFDPLLNTGVRFFVRDSHENPADLVVTVASESIDPTGGLGGFTTGPNTTPPRSAITDSGFKRLVPPKRRHGAAAWVDDTLAANAAREALRSSAGVSVPGASFVVGWLAVYLVLIVPANWFFFHALGRVELAWIAAPLLAVLGALVVVRQAQLDIGFVRAQTEIAVLELQPDTPRGVLTRFTALYTSLSTTYDLEFASGTALAAPFPRVGPKDPFSRLDLPGEVVFQRQERARLLGLAVSSASTEFVRSEELVDLAGAVPEGSSRVGKIGMGESRTGVPRVENFTEWPMTSVAVVRRPDGLEGPATLEGCWIGELPAGKAATVSFAPISATADLAPFKEQRAAERQVGDAEDTRLDLEPLFALALDPRRFEPGESRVVGRIDRQMEGLTVEPAASQRTGVTLVVGHLAYGPLPPTRSDTNAPLDVSMRKN